MKKLLSLALCALMIFSAAATVFAAEENVYAIDFEAKEVGVVGTAMDAYALHNTPKNGVIEIVNFQGSKVLHINHKANEAAYGCFSQFLYNNAEGIAKWGTKNQFVVEYDLYFESTSDDMIFTLATGSGQGATGTAWLEPALIKGKDLSVFIAGTEKAVTNLKLKTWYKIAVAFDLDKKVCSVNINGKSYAKDLPFSAFNADIVGPLVKFVRVAYAKNFKGDSAVYIDNAKVYNATAPRAYTPSAPQTADIAVVLAAVSAVAASGVIVSKKRK